MMISPNMQPIHNGLVMEKTMDFETHTALMGLPKRYGDAVCRNDVAAFVAVFTEDGVWDAAVNFLARGHMEIGGRFSEAQGGIEWVTQLPVSTLILECSAQRARLRTYCLEYIKLAGQKPSVGVWTYTDDCIKEPDGDWRISLHKLHVIFYGDPSLQNILQLGFPAPSS